MKLKLLGSLIMMFGLLSCGQQNDKKAEIPRKEDYPEIRKFLVEEFNIKEYLFADLDSSLKYIDHYPHKEIILYPGQFKLRYFEFYYPFDYNPFAIRITSQEDSLIGLFTFTDELYYLHNEVKGVMTFENEIVLQEQTYKGYLHKQNLETNLNSIIHKLGYQNDKHQIENLINVLFKDLLEMKDINLCKVQELYTLPKGKYEQELIQQYLQNLSILEDKCTSSFLCLNAKEGESGYWIFSINDLKDSFGVKVEFVGDLLYSSVYM